MKVYNILLILVVIMLVFTGCVSKETNGNIDNPAIQATEGSSDNAATDATPECVKNETPEERIAIITDADQLYTEEQLIIIERYIGTINELMETYPPNYVLKDDTSYKTLYYGKYTVTVITFDLSGEYIAGALYAADIPKTEFESIQIGDMAKTVKNIDPNVQFLFMETGSNDVPKYTIHYTSDKYLITITYDDQWLIENIDFRDIKTGDGSLS